MKICAGPLQTDVWDRLGKPDFRRARLIVENFLPAGCRPYLPPRALKLLTFFLLLFWLQGTGSSPHKGAHPKQAWLAQKIGTGKWWTCHLVGRLRMLGLLDSYRSYYKGRASVLVYFPGGMLWRMLHAALRTKGKARPRHDPLEAAFERFLVRKSVNKNNGEKNT